MMRSIFWQISQQRNEKIEDMKTTITGIRSGGQSGVDRAALDFARKHNMEICGWCPKGGWAEDYPEAPGILAVYPELQETKEGIELGKPMFTAHGVEDAAEIAAWLRSLEVAGPNGIELCVGGPRASECPDGYRVTMEILEKVKELLDLTKFGIRVMTIDDYEKVYALWMSCKNMGFNNLDDSRAGIEKYLRRNPSTCFVAERGEKIVGVILSGHDGRRGFIHHLAVAEDCRRQGIATELLERVVSSLAAEGINKVALLVFNRNEAGNAFWEKNGFTRREDLAYRNKALVEMVRIDT